MSTARAQGVDHILAVDVSLPSVNLSDRSSLLEVSFSIFDHLNKRSQSDTLSSRDRLVWLELPRLGPMDFGACDSLIELGYREARARVHEFASLVGVDSGAVRRDSVDAAAGFPEPVDPVDALVDDASAAADQTVVKVLSAGPGRWRIEAVTGAPPEVAAWEAGAFVERLHALAVSTRRTVRVDRDPNDAGVLATVTVSPT